MTNRHVRFGVAMTTANIINRLHEACRTNNHYQLCCFLGFSCSAIDGWLKRNSRPYEACYRCYQQTGTSIHWLLTGIGPKRIEVPGRQTAELNEDQTVKSSDKAEFQAINADIAPEALQPCVVKGLKEAQLFGLLQWSPDPPQATVEMIANRIAAEWQLRHTHNKTTKPSIHKSPNTKVRKS